MIVEGCHQFSHGRVICAHFAIGVFAELLHVVAPLGMGEMCFISFFVVGLQKAAIRLLNAHRKIIIIVCHQVFVHDADDILEVCHLFALPVVVIGVYDRPGVILFITVDVRIRHEEVRFVEEQFVVEQLIFTDAISKAALMLF